MKAAFRAILTGASAITDICPAARINWGAKPQGAGFPAVVLWLTGDAEGLVMNGPSGVSIGRVQVDCYALTAKGADDLAQAIRSRLHGYRGGRFALIEHAGTRDWRESGTNEPQRPFAVGLDFITSWRTWE